MLLWRVFYIFIIIDVANTFWMGEEAIRWAISHFEKSESHVKGNRDWSAPFISGDGFRHHCPHRCDETNMCRMVPERVTNGSCIFIKSDMFALFVHRVMPHISNTFVLVVHNGDLSSPDGQTDAPSIGLPQPHLSHVIKQKYNEGLLLAQYSSNLWWRSVHPGNHSSIIRGHPPHLHCLPIGIENRMYSIGARPKRYINAMKRQLNQTKLDVATRARLERKHLLLIAFTPKRRAPDRSKALDAVLLKGVQALEEGTFYNYVPSNLSHEKWLEAISRHKFVLAPHGHGLDTHRITEILLMGGIPVMKKSSISSCYDDTDNEGPTGAMLRGSLPVVVVKQWSDVTEERLLQEWARIDAFPRDHWDWRRLFLPQWLARIDAHASAPVQSPLSGTSSKEPLSADGKST